MRRGSCQCGRKTFFGNSLCLGCGRSLGRCWKCGQMSSFALAADSSRWTCDACLAVAFSCRNRDPGGCNGYNPSPEKLCRYCQFTRVVPELSQPGNLAAWVELERAKRRLLVQLDHLQLPPFSPDPAFNHPLAFEFKHDQTLPDGSLERVFTGHQNGCITVNVQEADSVYRERIRVELGEPQRTLIGHMRHEYGHYLNGCCEADCPDRCRLLFGDPQAVSYADAKWQYYQQGPAADWSQRHASAYATMHPWEDFAETVNLYLDLMAIAETANDQQTAAIDVTTPFDFRQAVPDILAVAIAASEFNLDMGLPVLLPESIAEPVVDKLEFIHGLRRLRRRSESRKRAGTK